MKVTVYLLFRTSSASLNFSNTEVVAISLNKDKLIEVMMKKSDPMDYSIKQRTLSGDQVKSLW